MKPSEELHEQNKLIIELLKALEKQMKLNYELNEIIEAEKLIKQTKR